QDPADNAAPAPAANTAAPAATPAPAEGARGVVPVAYQGEWNADLNACGTGMHDSRLEIGPDTISFYESSGRIKSASEWEGGDLTILADVTGEGETRETTHTYRLSADGQTLTDLNGGLVRKKCPAS
ncbi:MAG TPA: hypothetical protein VD906_02165, partial [Caulobacteraceae bacterium]|nr:hypothetical protein [Caulobacteraceae bacterium]